MKRSKLRTLLHLAPLASALVLTGCGSADGTLQMPIQASAQAAGAGGIDWIYYFIYWLCVFYFVHIMGAMLWFMWRYRRRAGVAPEHSAHHNLALEVAWTLPPILLVVVMFWWGFESYMDLATPPADAFKVEVKGKKWSWTFTYPNGATSNELHVVKGKPAHMVMASDDVLHSFFVPVFRVKQDVVPGRFTNLWFTPIRATEPRPADPAQEVADKHFYWLFCTEYCGTQHSSMWSKVYVHETEEELNEYLRTISGPLGPEQLYAMHCQACHNIEGQILVGPSFRGLAGSQRQVFDPATGQTKTVTADDQYLHESIVNPGALLSRDGQEFPNAMNQNFGQVLSEDEIQSLIEFIKGLK